MLKYSNLKHELSLLIKAQDWATLRAWFGIWNDDEMKLDKFFLWCHHFFPHYFRDSSPVFHRELARAYFSDQDEAEAAPRGFSKTTLFQAGVLFDCTYELEKFIVVIEKTFTEAAEVISAVREECVSNEGFLAVYGDMLGNEKSREVASRSKSKDAEGDVFINGVRLRAKGFDSSVRGIKSREWRPTKILGDDLEKDEHINSPEQRLKYEDRLNKQVRPAVDKEGTVKVFGTILHEDSLLMNEIQKLDGIIYRAFYTPSDAEWAEVEDITTEVVIPGIGPVRLLWASRWDWASLMRKKKAMTKEGFSSHAFEQEYRNNPIAEEARKFKWEWLNNPERRIKLKDLVNSGKTLVGYCCIDTADATTVGADYTATVVWLVDPNGNCYRVDVRNDKRNINGLVQLIFDVWEVWSRHGLVKIGVEKRAFEDQLKPLLDEEKRKRGVYPVVEELKHMGRSKENRILGALQGRYEHGKIWTVVDERGMVVGDTDALTNQLYNFPSSKHDDLSDAEAYISDILAVPMADEKSPSPHRDPIDDPFESQKPSRYDFMDHQERHLGRHDHEVDPYL